MSETKPTPTETQITEESLNSNAKTVNIRLRKGEYQYDLAKGIASFQLELDFPDVKDLATKLYGEGNANDDQFIRKIQTILKKMERSNIVRILPKKNPWELQRYALSGFNFEDVDKNRVRLATPKQIRQAKSMLRSVPSSREGAMSETSYGNAKIWLSALIIITSYAAALWSLLQPLINPMVFIPAFYIAIATGVLLGKLLSQK